MARRGRLLPGEHALSQARERAFNLLYEAEMKGLTPSEVLAEQIVDPEPLTQLLIDGVTADRAELDEMISANARGWTLARMPALDKAVLRLAITELRHRPEVPVAVILDEAVGLAKRFSTDDSGRFVNGMLSTIARQIRPNARFSATPVPPPTDAPAPDVEAPAGSGWAPDVDEVDALASGDPAELHADETTGEEIAAQSPPPGD